MGHYLKFKLMPNSLFQKKSCMIYSSVFYVFISLLIINEFINSIYKHLVNIYVDRQKIYRLLKAQFEFLQNGDVSGCTRWLVLSLIDVCASCKKVLSFQDKTNVGSIGLVGI